VRNTIPIKKRFVYKYMLTFFSAVICLLLFSCTTSPEKLRSNVTYQEVAKVSSCEEISTKIKQLNEILESVTPSETERLYKDTAMSAAKTGVSLSGILGAAGPLASLGINFMEGLYKINTKKRQEAIKIAAEEKKTLMWNAYYHKECIS